MLYAAAMRAPKDRAIAAPRMMVNHMGIFGAPLAVRPMLGVVVAILL
jgi:hypothetical protein